MVGGQNMKNPGVFLMSPWEFAMHWEVLRLPSPPKNDSAGAISRWINSEDDLADEEDQEFEPIQKINT